MDYSQTINSDLKRQYKKELDLLQKLFEKYNFFDLCRSVYCINSYLPNRHHFEMNLILNYALSLCSRNGVKTIDKYDDFVCFSNCVSRIIKPSKFEDEIVTDNGEFKICFQNKFYSVFLGNSLSFSFPVYQCIEMISKTYCFDKKMRDILEYQDREIGKIKKYSELTRCNFTSFHIPSLEYFENIKTSYNSQDNVLFDDFTLDNNGDILKAHFVNNNGQFLRIFNTSLVIDAFYKFLDKNESKAADLCFLDSVFKNFNFYGRSNNALFKVGIIDDLKSKNIIDDFIFKAAIFDKETLVLFSNINDFKNGIFKQIKKKIESKINNHKLYVAEINGNKMRVMHFDKVKTLIIVTYYPYFNITIPNFHGRIEMDKLEIGVLDLASLFYESPNISDLIEFFNLYYKGETDNVVSMFSGIISIFRFWLNNKKLISRGAINYNMILPDVYDSEHAIFNKYKEIRKWFPFDNPSNIFLNPYRWNVYIENNNFVEISDKSLNGSFGGQIKLMNNHYLFFACNLELFIEKNSKLLTIIQTMQDLNAIYANKIETEMIKSGCLDYNMEIIFLPFSYATKVDNTGFTKSNKKYVYSDATIKDGNLVVRYTINEEQFVKDMIAAKDNYVEIIYLLELFDCLRTIKTIKFSVIQQAIINLKGKKEVKIIAKEIKYYKSENIYDVCVSNIALSRIDKLFAEKCLQIGIKPGKYEKNTFTRNIRKLQEIVIPIFEQEITKYNKTELHQLLLSILSSRTFNKSADDDRVKLSDSDDLEEKARNTCKLNIVKSRTEHVSYIRFLNYLIDTNLSIERDSLVVPNDKEVEYLMAFAERLVLFQDSSDNAHYNLLPIELYVDNDYIPRVKYMDTSDDIIKKREGRRLSIKPYLPSLEFDKKYLSDTSDNFKKDTGVSLMDIFKICEYLKLEFTYTFKKEIKPNVFAIDKNQLIQDAKQVYQNIEIKEIKRTIDYLIIDCFKIKFVGGNQEKFVPLWEREKREHRNETKPIFESNNLLIFSPILINDFEDKWQRAIFNFYPLYEIGLDNTIKFLTEWKHECEKKMEKDIKSLFKANCSYQGVELYKIDKQGNHPKNIGDFDVLAIDRNKKIMYNLEAKFLIFTGSIRENYNLQSSFFISDKRDEHFQKRIDYLSTCYKRILSILFSVVDAEKYKLVNYMVTNKMFYCDIKKINFDIITFSELRTIVGQ